MNKNVVIGLVIGLLAIVGAVTFASNRSSAPEDNNQAISAGTNTTNSTSQETSNELLKYVDTTSEQYTNMKQYLPADQYDEYFIANMIHFSEGVEQLEAMAAKSSNAVLADGASKRSADAKEKVAFYKQMQKDKGFPISYGDNMQYHGAMGADSAVYYAISSLEGLSGEAYEKELLAQVIEFRKNQSVIAAIGLDLTTDETIKNELNEVLKTNKDVLDQISKA